MLDAPPVIHIGFHKTGSTALQTSLFPFLAGCTALLRSGPHRHREFDHLAANLLSASEETYLGHTMGALMGEVARRDGGTLLVSDERFSGDIFRRSYNRERTAHRLYGLLPDASILLCVRSQPSLLRSLYSEYVRRCAGYARFGDFVQGKAEGADFTLENLCFDRLVELYQDLFGSDRVHVLPFELLQADQSRFVAELVEVVAPGTDPAELPHVRVANGSLTRPARDILRPVNRWIRKSPFNANPRVVTLIDNDRNLARTATARRLQSEIARVNRTRLFRKIGTGLAPAEQLLLDGMAPFFEEPNRRLEKLTGLELGTWGYPLAGQA